MAMTKANLFLIAITIITAVASVTFSAMTTATPSNTTSSIQSTYIE